jgi:hypothetical protein
MFDLNLGRGWLRAMCAVDGAAAEEEEDAGAFSNTAAA